METLSSLTPDLWVATRPLPLVVGDIGTRMTVVRLPDGGLFLVRFGIRDREAARGSIRKILAWDFDRIIVTHGDVLETDGKRRFADGFSSLL